MLGYIASGLPLGGRATARSTTGSEITAEVTERFSQVHVPDLDVPPDAATVEQLLLDELEGTVGGDTG